MFSVLVFFQKQFKYVGLKDDEWELTIIQFVTLHFCNQDFLRGGVVISLKIGSSMGYVVFGFAREIKIALDYNLFLFENVAVHEKIAGRIDLKAVLVYAPVLDLHYKF